MSPFALDAADTKPQGETLHVFDLPQIHTRPSAEQLHDALSSLRLRPRSWSDPSSTVLEDELGQSEFKTFDSDGVTQYLTSIVSSSLKWIASEKDREAIWEQASHRMSERSGRSGMSAMSRSFEIPMKTGSAKLIIHEPALTSDNLGFKTWAASYLLAKRLIRIELPPSFWVRPSFALELGAGTGLVGIAAAAVLGAQVCVTDLPVIEVNLRRNVEANTDMTLRHGGQAASAVLDWTHPKSIEWPGSASSIGSNACMENLQKRSSFPLILAADSIYSAEHPKLLAETVVTWLSKDSDARVIVELPRRLGFEQDLEDFRVQMQIVGLDLLEEDDEFGFDDWGDGKTEDQMVKCWFSVWGWHRKG